MLLHFGTSVFSVSLAELQQLLLLEIIYERFPIAAMVSSHQHSLPPATMRFLFSVLEFLARGFTSLSPAFSIFARALY